MLHASPEAWWWSALADIWLSTDNCLLRWLQIQMAPNLYAGIGCQGLHGSHVLVCRGVSTNGSFNWLSWTSTIAPESFDTVWYLPSDKMPPFGESRVFWLASSPVLWPDNTGESPMILSITRRDDLHSVSDIHYDSADWQWRPGSLQRIKDLEVFLRYNFDSARKLTSMIDRYPLLDEEDEVIQKVALLRS